MGPSEFVKQIEEYYGDYRPKVKEMVMIYIYPLSGSQLDRLWKEVILKFSGQYKVPPDVAIFQKLRREINDTIECDRSKALPDMTRDPEMQEKVAGLFRKLGEKFGW